MGVYIILGGMVLSALVIGFLDWLDERRERRERHAHH